MTASNTTAFRNFSLAASGAVLAASAWAAGAAPEGLMLDARLWREEIVAANEEGIEEGWYEIAVTADAVRVRAVAKPRANEPVRQDAMFLHRPGAALVEGVRINHGFPTEEFRPVVGHRYQRTLGRTEYSFKVWSNAVGTAYVISYDGSDHEYLLGLPAAATKVLAVADLDGDRKPDFVVDVGGEIFLLLSSDAKAGLNLPSAQLWAAAE
ncbi:hypothetical protein [Ramlibacter albus]|uniref:VCBS repeat-containing protein n=1 Tax=Ramlibacter albus TaxID=2079448 RepID=A0A923M983_9BURK|nr:hypothetical protein [Ramlibacter albus]MBC5765089.1 hypothetical protein [Ramlibacter albus]